MRHVRNDLMRAIKYFFCRLDGDEKTRKLVNFYRAARIFDPCYAKTVGTGMAKNLINDLEQFRPIEDKRLSKTLLRSFARFKNKAISIDNNSDSVNILQWHYDICRFTCESDTDDLWAWYETCKLVVLVVPSSGALERVFSLLKEYWGIQQTHSLSDNIMLSLYLSYNKRHVRDFIE